MKSTGEVMGIDLTFSGALAKALIASGVALPRQGSILLSIADKDKPEALPIIKDLAGLGYQLIATEGTAAMIDAVGLPVRMVTKKLDQGHPNVLDVIRDGVVQGVVNTLEGHRQPMRDGFAIRRGAVERGIPCFTSLDTFRAVVASLMASASGYSVRPLAEYLK
jgi:carbamoyl-phosphate synthase large subunit